MKAKALLPILLSGALLAAGAQAATKDVTVAVASTFTTMDPYNASDTLSQAVAKSFYEGLFTFDKNMKIVNVLAESYEPSADGLTYVVKLRQGVKFHDGSDFNAEAVKMNYERVMDKKNGLKRFVLFSNIDHIDVVDPYTVKFTLKKPFSAFINQLAHPSGVMICPSTLKGDASKIAFNPCGTGPFVMKDYNPSEVLRVEKNPNYWRAGYPKVDSITWRPVVENSTRVAMMLTGEAQYAFPIPAEQVKQIEGKGNVRLDITPSIIMRYVEMNLTKKQFQDVRVRQALNYAINKEALVKVAFAGYADPATGVAPMDVDYAEKLGPWPYDPKKARELLKEAGYPNGFETTLWSGYNHTTAMKIIQFMQQQLRQVGIKTTVRALEAGQRTALVEAVPPEKSEHQLYYIGWSSSTGEMDYAIRPLLATSSFTPNDSNESYYSNADVDTKLMEALATTDRAKKAELYSSIQKQIWNDAPWIFLVTEKNIAGSSPNLTGFYIQPDASFNFSEIELK
ncbi:glutathione ABC transporter substrate-binding protein GsiB [Sutterella sp.]|uniref:glutathione ABC transporter substrate-binding protein GsiB n=1 Tax=Sutterella sp. TaxID=1981025 RepID=UPI0026E0E528|nr:glutathione ABC transporter substrate-binding protein GsiB [Sutterella sp.]MDO5532448.1 glutathione ABC transporter substrate-binding protein GsiB [Sutterella sp.]